MSAEVAERFRGDAERIIDNYKPTPGDEAPVEVMLAYICLSKIAPPNPLYRGEWVVSLDGGQATISIPLPGNRISKDDAEHMIANMELIIRQLKRRAGIDQETKASVATPG